MEALLSHLWTVTQSITVFFPLTMGVIMGMFYTAKVKEELEDTELCKLDSIVDVILIVAILNMSRVLFYIFKVIVDFFLILYLKWYPKFEHDVRDTKYYFYVFVTEVLVPVILSGASMFVSFLSLEDATLCFGPSSSEIERLLFVQIIGDIICVVVIGLFKMIFCGIDCVSVWRNRVDKVERKVERKKTKEELKKERGFAKGSLMVDEHLDNLLTSTIEEEEEEEEGEDENITSTDVLEEDDEAFRHNLSTESSDYLLTSDDLNDSHESM